VLDAIRAAKRGSTLELEIVRAGAITTSKCPSRARAAMSSVYIPLIYSYERERDTDRGLGADRHLPLAQHAGRVGRAPLVVLLVGGGDSNRLEAVER